jgi:hypothetical protein
MSPPALNFPRSGRQAEKAAENELGQSAPHMAATSQ